MRAHFILLFVSFLIIHACAPVAPSSSSVQTADQVTITDPPTQDTTSVETQSTPQRAPRIYKPSRSRSWDLLHTSLKLSFDWEKQHVLGEAELQLTPYFYSQNQLILDAKGFQVHEIYRLENDQPQAVDFHYDSLQLTISFHRSFKKGDNVWVYIKYTARPETIPGFGNEAIQGEKGLYFINPDSTENKPQQIWTQGETEFSSCWFPTIDAPNERCTQEMYLTVQDRFQTLSNGVLVWSREAGEGYRTDYWKMDQPHAPYLFMLAVGEFAVVEDEWRSIPLQYWVEPEFEPYAKDIFGNTPEMLTFFSDKLGVEFPWQKYAQVVVRDFVSGAMENTTASVFMNALQVDSRSLLDEHWDGIIAHELFHQWFGDYVTTESWPNLPLNESFADYSEYLWVEHKYSYDSAEYLALESLFDYLEEAEDDAKPLIRYYVDDPGDMFDRHSYNKGGRVLHMLRKYVGDEAFFASLKEYLTTNAFQSVEIHNLRLAFEKVTGQDLQWFFEQWFMQPGHPVLNVVHQYDSVRNVLVVEVSQIQDTQFVPIYQLPLSIEIVDQGDPWQYDLWVTDAIHTFEFEVQSAPDAILVDPDRQLLGVILHEKEPHLLYNQAQTSWHFFHRLSAFSQFAQVSQDTTAVLYLATQALKDEFWLNRLVALGYFEGYAGQDVDAIANQLRDIQENDPVPAIRAEALAILASLPISQEISDYYIGLRDSAYSVVGTAITYLGDLDVPEYSLQTTLEEFQTYTNVQVVLPLAEFYLSKSISGMLAWYIQKLFALNGQDRYYFIAYIAEYILSLPESEQKNGMEALLEVAQDDNNYYVRAASLNALDMLNASGVWTNQIDAVKEAEKDPRVLQFYRAE